VTRLARRDGDAGKVTLPCVLGNTHLRAAAFVGAMDPTRAAARLRALIPGPKMDRRRTEPWSSRRLRERMRLPEALRDLSCTGRPRKRGIFPTSAGRRAIRRPGVRGSGPGPAGRRSGAQGVRGSGPRRARGVPERARPVPGAPQSHRPVPSPRRNPHVLGVSSRSQPARTAMRRPGPPTRTAPRPGTPKAHPATRAPYPSWSRESRVPDLEPPMARSKSLRRN
jgi:hypothetical protein